MYAKKNSGKKVVATLLAIVLLIGCGIGGTLAWLKDKTTPVVNTFTASDIKITLTESNNPNLKMVPGAEITKDPKVTVLSNSEACYLFVKVETSNTEDFITYTIADGWMAVVGENNVYYRLHDATTESNGTPISILAGDKVDVKTTVTKAMMEALTDANSPKLTFTAYAVQQLGFDTAEAAWAEAELLG